MGKTATNISIVLGVITIAFGGYYLYTNYSGAGSSSAYSDQTMQNMLNNTRVFIDHEQTLEGISLDISLFEDERFKSLRSYSTPIKERPIGRPDPFADPNRNVSRTNI